MKPFRYILRYQPAPEEWGRSIGIWLAWSVLTHFAWLSRGHLFPITGLILLPNLYWQLAHLAERVHDEILEGVKNFFEVLAAQVGSGLSVESGVCAAVRACIDQQRVHRRLAPLLEKLAAEVDLGLFGRESFSEIAHMTQVPLMRQFSDMLALAGKTGGSVEQMLLYFSGALSEIQRNKRQIISRLSGKRAEFQIMMLMPLGATLAAKALMGTYYDIWYEWPLGILFLTFVTACYSGACWMYYFNSHRIVNEEVKN